MNLDELWAWWAAIPTLELIWVGVGMVAQFLFSLRFIVQWIVSERARRSIVPEIFWYFSIAGGAMLLIYAIHRMDPVFILGQAGGLVIYVRNVYFIWRDKRQNPRLAEVHLSDQDSEVQVRRAAGGGSRRA